MSNTLAIVMLASVAVVAYGIGRWHEYHLLNLKWRSIPRTAKRAFIEEALRAQLESVRNQPAPRSGT